MKNVTGIRVDEEVANDVNAPPLQLSPYLASRLGLDAIRKQYVPSEEEKTIRKYELGDPINDDGKSPIKGLIHRYSNRVLLKITNQCEAYCRFCFRREFVGTKTQAFLTNREFEAVCKYIEGNTQINEVIFSGGDPLILSPRRLRFYCDRLEAIENVRMIRFHTRLPMQAPQKINDELIGLFASLSKPVNLVLHINHFNEFENLNMQAIERLKSAGVNLFSQTVLLSGINDCVETLEETFNQILALSIKPYYLHHTDLARGTSHFAISLKNGMALYSELSKKISGIALPNYVLDMPDGSGKIRLCETRIRQGLDGNFEILDNDGKWRFYPNIGTSGHTS